MRLPKVKISKTITFNKSLSVILEQAHFDLPEKYMDDYKKILGDAKAHVSVSSDMVYKDFGSGAGAMVSVSLSCGQDAETVEQAIELAGAVARSYCIEMQKQAEQEFRKAREQAGLKPI